MYMKKFVVILTTTFVVLSCNISSKETVPNYFKHGMHGNVESVYTETYQYRNGLKETYPRNYLFLWGDKFAESSSRKKFDIYGNIREITTYTDWATFTDSTVVTYEYDGQHLVSSTRKLHSRKYSTPTVQPFIYTDGNISGWDDQKFTVNDDKQISEIHSSFSISVGLHISRIEVFNNDGVMTAMYDAVSKDMQICNTLDENGAIVKYQEFGSSPATSSNDTIIYTRFDHKGNWIQRAKVDLERLDTTYQSREIRYFDEGELIK